MASSSLANFIDTLFFGLRYVFVAGVEQPEAPNLDFEGPVSASFDSVNNRVVITYASTLPPSGTAGGDLANSYPNPTVAKLLGLAIPAVTGNNGKVLGLVAGLLAWVTGGGGGGYNVVNYTVSSGPAPDQTAAFGDFWVMSISGTLQNLILPAPVSGQAFVPIVVQWSGGGGLHILTSAGITFGNVARVSTWIAYTGNGGSTASSTDLYLNNGCVLTLVPDHATSTWNVVAGF